MLTKDSKTGTLYVIATPIGNLEDITLRALRKLKEIEICAAEDTRKSRILFNFFQINTTLVSYNKDSERTKLTLFIDKLREGKDVGLISDAGTPLISDPGFLLIKEASKLDIKISPIPGASALTSSVSVCNLPVDRFTFLGFPPRKGKSRNLFLKDIENSPYSSIIFESGKRIEGLLEDFISIGSERSIFLGREITKLHESFYRGIPKDVLNKLRTSQNHLKGEFVVIFQGRKKNSQDKYMSKEDKRVLQILMEKLPNNQALSIGSEILGIKKNLIYKQIID